LPRSQANVAPNNHDSDKRTVLKGTGLALSALVGGSTIAGAEEKLNKKQEKGTQNMFITVENGEFCLNLHREDVSDFKYRMWTAVVQDFNQAIKSGHISLEEKASVSTSQQSGEVGGSTFIEVHSNPSEMVKEGQE